MYFENNIDLKLIIYTIIDHIIITPNIVLEQPWVGRKLALLDKLPFNC